MNLTTRGRILIFDSGVGGLSIAQAIRQALPDCRYIYCSDNAAFPYGTKSDIFVRERTIKVVSKLVEVYAPNLVVIACNTASTVALPALRAALTIPVIGVVPAIKPAARHSQSKVVGLLATPATVKRPYTQKLIADFASECQVFRFGSSRLVQIAEEKLRGAPIAIEDIRSEIANLFCQDETRTMDTVVLGCTHFPLLLTELNEAAPWKVSWLDSATAIADRAATLLPAFEDHLPPDILNTAVFTGVADDLIKIETSMNAYGFGVFANVLVDLD